MNRNRAALVVLGAALVVGCTTQTAARPAAAPTVPTVTPGQPITQARDSWEITVLDFGPWDRFTTRERLFGKTQGRLVVLEFSARNLGREKASFKPSDFTLTDAAGRKFTPDGPYIDLAVVSVQAVQAGLTTHNRVVFDVSPVIHGYRLTALGMSFDLVGA